MPERDISTKINHAAFQPRPERLLVSSEKVNQFQGIYNDSARILDKVNYWDKVGTNNAEFKPLCTSLALAENYTRRLQTGRPSDFAVPLFYELNHVFGLPSHTYPQYPDQQHLFPDPGAAFLLRDLTVARIAKTVDMGKLPERPGTDKTGKRRFNIDAHGFFRDIIKQQGFYVVRNVNENWGTIGGNYCKMICEANQYDVVKFYLENPNRIFMSPVEQNKKPTSGIIFDAKSQATG